MRRSTGQDAEILLGEYDAAAAVRRCKAQRIQREKALERARRITNMDPTQVITRVAMVPIDSRTVGIPSDIRRSASYTSLYVLGTGSRLRALSLWGKVRLALDWMIAYFRAQKMNLTISEAKLNTKETDMIAPYANLLKVSSHRMLSKIIMSTIKACYIM